MAIGTEAVRRAYAKLLASPPSFAGVIRPAIRNGDIAITSTTRAGNATVEVARRQPDSTWLWMIDQPNVLERPALAPDAQIWTPMAGLPPHAGLDTESGGYRTSALSRRSQCVTVIVVTRQSVVQRPRRSR